MRPPAAMPSGRSTAIPPWALKALERMAPTIDNDISDVDIWHLTTLWVL